METKRRSSDFLHGDPLSQILIKLPVKSLLRFKCVCKQWRSMIESPEFISEHATTYRDNVTEKFLLDHSSERKCLVHERETLKRTGVYFWHPFERDLISGFRDQVDGVILLEHEDSREVVLWNPSIRKHIILPSGEDGVDRFRESEFSQMTFALGYDGLRHDYKVVVIIYYCNKYYVDDDGGCGVRNDDLGDGVDEDWSDGVVVDDWEKKGRQDLPSVLPNTVPVVVGVYSLNENSWKTIAHSTRLIRLGGYSERVFLKGAINFIGNITKKSVKGKLKERIIAFDVSTEVFRYFMVPKDDTESCVTRKLGALGESLVILDHVRFPSEYCCLWVMEKYGVSHSWTRQYTIGVEDANPFFVLRFSKIGQIIFAHKDGGIRSYNVINGQTIDYGKGSDFRLVTMSVYQESLALSTAGKQILVDDKSGRKGIVNLIFLTVFSFLLKLFRIAAKFLFGYGYL